MLENAAGINRVIVACGYVDMRKGVDDLAQIIGDKYSCNPFEKGTLFLFCGRRTPKSETGKGLNYSMNQENYLRTFLTDGEVPIDNSASERSIRTFCIGKKNFVLINSIKGADASAVIYSLSKTAKLNNLNPYYYFGHPLFVLPQYITYNDKEGNIDTTKLSEKVLQELLPWSDKLPVKCHKTRR